MEDTKVGAGSKDDPAQVAKQGFDALMASKDKILASSVKTKVQNCEQGAPGQGQGGWPSPDPPTSFSRGCRPDNRRRFGLPFREGGTPAAGPTHGG